MTVKAMKRMNKVTVGFLTVLFLFAATVVPIYAAESKALSLTPDGNMTLIDDYVIGDTQYITVQTKDGNYFYIIIDRNGETENVHFLNKVDEEDLLPLIGEDQIFETDTEQVPDTTPELPADTDKQEERKAVLTRGLILLGIFGAVGGGVFLLSKKKGTVSKSADDTDDEEDGTVIVGAKGQNDEVLDVPESKETQSEPEHTEHENIEEDKESEELTWADTKINTPSISSNMTMLEMNADS